MIKTLLLTTLSLTSFLSHSQYCTNSGATSTIDSNVESVNLIGDVGSISFSGCPGIIGVQDLTGLSTTLSAGGSYSIDIQFGTCGGNYAGAGEAWIDYNNNQIFEASESIGTWVGTPPTSISTFNFNVPAGITNSTTRMRVTQSEGASLPLDPCATFTWGSTMDFSIVLTGGIDCSPYIGNNTADPIIVSAFPYSNTHNSSFCYTNENNAYLSPDVFYLILPTPGIESLDVSLCGSSFDTFLSVFDTEGNTITFNDDGSCGAQSEVSFSTVGHDSLYVVVEGWGIESGDYQINIIKKTLGIDSDELFIYSIFPNPMNNHFKITNISNSTIFIHDLSGKLITQVNNYNGGDIDISNFRKGIYFVSFEINNKLINKKIIVE